MLQVLSLKVASWMVEQEEFAEFERRATAATRPPMMDQVTLALAVTLNPSPALTRTLTLTLTPTLYLTRTLPLPLTLTLTL